MSLTSLLAKFRKGQASQDNLYIVVQAGAVYVSETGHADILKFPAETSWESALEGALATVNGGGKSAVVILASQLYQSFQIEKPELPEEEWSTALPFLLKDLITERVTEIVADGYALADNKKAQTYVLSKSVLTPILNAVEGAGATLKRVIPEDEVWGSVQDEFVNFMLLHRSERANFKIGAYVEKKSRFQREIRGVAAPLTGTVMSELQIDSLALELQRSTDYLSSQIRDVSINHLFVCCDDEQQSILVQALSERLGVKVLPVNQQDQVQCGEVLLNVVKGIPPSGVNLFPEHLKPKQELLTLNNVAIAWGILTFIMFGVYGYYAVEKAGYESRIEQLTSEKKSTEDELKVFQSKLAAHKPTPSKLEAIERLKIEIKDKERSLSAIYEFDSGGQAGYSGVMNALTKLETGDISISNIALNGGNLNLAGLARTPASVPKWVNQFKSEVELQGRSFKKLTLGRNEDDIVTFKLTTNLDEKSFGEATPPKSEDQ